MLDMLASSFNLFNPLFISYNSILVYITRKKLTLLISMISNVEL